MNHPEIEERRVLDRYLLGQLPAEEVQRFEHHYLSCPRCLDELETTEHLVGGLRDAAAEDVARVALGAGLARWAWRSRLGASLLGLALLLPAALLYQRLRAAGAELDAARAPRPAAVLALSPLRGAPTTAPVHQVRLDPAWAIVLSLELDRPEHARYRVVLRALGGAPEGGVELWRDELVPDFRDTLSVAIVGGTLGAGDYAVDVVALPDEVEVARFAFRALE